MSQNFVSKLTLDGSGFNKTLDDAGKSVNDFQKQTGDASKTVDDLGKSTKRTASELLKEMKAMEGGARSVSNYRSQLSQMTRQIQDLQINYNAMSNEMKNSDFGREVASQIQELTQRAAEMKDQVQDAAASVKLLSSDTANLDAAKSALEGIGSAMQLVASAGILGEENTEKVVKALAKLKAIESATNAVLKIANTFNKDNILMLKLRTIWTQAQTKAQLANNKATNAGSKAVKTLTVALKSCPFAIVATAIVALIAAYTAWSEKTHQQIEMQRKLGRRLNEDTEAMKKYGDAVGSSVGKALSSFDALASKFKLLETYKDKEKFLKDYAKEMENLGLKAKTVNDLEEIFIKNADDYRAAIELKAQYLALQGLIEEAYSDYYKKAALASKQGQTYKKGDRLSKPEMFFTDLNGLVEGVDYTVIERDYFGNIIAELTGPGAQKLSNAMTGVFNDAATAGAKAAAKPYMQMMDQIANDPRYKMLYGGSGGSGGSGNSNSEYKEGSLAWYDAQIKALQNLLQNEKLTQAQLKDINKQIEQLEKERLAYIQSLRGGSVEAIPQLKMIGTSKALQDLQKHYEEHPLKVKAEVELKEYTMHDFYSAANDALGSIGSINSGISGIYSKWSSFAEDMENKNPFEQMLYSIDALISTMQTIVSIMDTINGLSKVFNTLQEIGLGIQAAKNQAKQEEITEEGVLIGEKATEAEISATTAAADAASSASKIPYVGWILAIGAVAAILAAISGAKSVAHFAKGGIVPGSSFSGDSVSAQLNSGEMVLTTSQQARLFDLLNGSGSINRSSNKVEFVIKGQELKGVLNNYDKKMSRI